MKRLTIVMFMAFVSLMSFAQGDANNSTEIYLMKTYLGDGTATTYDVGSVDSIVFNVVSLSNSGSVDLGLSVKWAACNIGASSPEDYGNYYAWGEIETKDEYTSSNSVTNGVEMDDISGNAEYDAATANWGGTWRMPTYDEMNELVDSCTWLWMTLNDTNGCLVTGPNGNSIFLPAAGSLKDTLLYYAGYNGLYWGSTTREGYTTQAHYLSFHDESYRVGSYYRVCGHPIRPVTD